jgi:hypothetical protein
VPELPALELPCTTLTTASLVELCAMCMPGAYMRSPAAAAEGSISGDPNAHVMPPVSIASSCFGASRDNREDRARWPASHS